MAIADLVVVGGGIVGLATAMEFLEQFPRARLTLLEKEPRLAAHQTGHNSGVIHSGIYYRPGSIKARTCVDGARRLVEFCETHRLPHAICGKLVIATKASEAPVLETLYERGRANGVDGLALISPERLREIEPYARGVKALHVPSAGIVDYAAVADMFADVIRNRGGTIQTSARVVRFQRRDAGWVLETTAGDIRAKYLIACGGLHADRLTIMAGGPSDVRVMPFRGEYYDVIPQRRSLVKSMIYPVPNPAVPFLGVHFTRTISGCVHAGPNAVLALKREGYRKRDVSCSDLFDMLTFPGFWKMAGTYWSVGLEELYRSMSKGVFVQALQRLVPDVTAEDLVPGSSGVRAQALDAAGTLLDDFNIVRGEGAIFVRNVPSPAATASISIGRAITQMAASMFTP